MSLCVTEQGDPTTSTVDGKTGTTYRGGSIKSMSNEGNCEAIKDHEHTFGIIEDGTNKNLAEPLEEEYDINLDIKTTFQMHDIVYSHLLD